MNGRAARTGIGPHGVAVDTSSTDLIDHVTPHTLRGSLGPPVLAERGPGLRRNM